MSSYNPRVTPWVDRAPKVMVVKGKRRGLLCRCEVPYCPKVAVMDNGKGASMRCADHAEVEPLQTDAPPPPPAGPFRAGKRQEPALTPEEDRMARALFLEFRGPRRENETWEGQKFRDRHNWIDHARSILTTLREPS